MLTYEQIIACPKRLLSFTTLNRGQFEELLERFEKVWTEYDSEVKADKATRKMKRHWHGGTAARTLTSCGEKLMFILLHLKFQPVQELLGAVFNMSQTRASHWIGILLPLLDKTFEGEEKPSRDPSILLNLPERTRVAIDGVERPIGRPVDSEEQTLHYSGKKKCHTIKNLLVTLISFGYILFLSPTVEGKRHDEKLRKDCGIKFAKQNIVYEDSGFEGHKEEGVKVLRPKKKPRNGELTEKERQSNRRIAQIRVGVEHSIRTTKYCRIVKDIYRGRREGFDDLSMEVATSLANFRVLNPNNKRSASRRKSFIKSILRRS